MLRRPQRDLARPSLLATALLGALATPALAAPTFVASEPEPRALYREGQPGRMLLAGRWYFRFDRARAWARVSVPHNWNGADRRLNRPAVGWYRRDFTLPRTPATLWVARFESVSHEATVFLNGRRVGSHSGASLPFEVDLRGLRRGRNRLVVRVSTVRSANDLTHWKPARSNGFGRGGWWNFGGISREVYVRPVRGLDIERVATLPRLACPGCPARVTSEVLLRNPSPRAVRATLTLRTDRATVARASVRLAGRSRRAIKLAFELRRPRIWKLGAGRLYGLRAVAEAPRGARSEHRSSFGVRSVSQAPDGRALLNGRAISLLGASLHEDDPRRGAAWGPLQRRAALAQIEELGATLVRAHYPLHPALLEALDRRGIAVWSQAPVYQLLNERLALTGVRRRAVAAVRDTVLRDRNHPAVIAWSMANELEEPIETGHAAYIRAAARATRALDPTRLVAIDRVDRIAQPEGHPALGAVDAIGLNEYFGWYRGARPPLEPAVTEDLGPHLDELRALYPGRALFVTEFGAEATRRGPASEKGTFAFQTQYLLRHLAIQRARSWLGGSVVWALRDFRVHPGWSGGNPLPLPPYNHKGLLEEDGSRKQAFDAVRRAFRTAP